MHAARHGRPLTSLLAKLAVFLYVCTLVCIPASALAADGPTTLRNPLKLDCADPWMTFSSGYYYLLCTRGDKITISKTTTVNDLGTVPEVKVFDDPTSQNACCNMWAPEMHQLNGPNGTRWYIYYTAGPSQCCSGQKTYVLESSGSDSTLR